MGFPDNHTRIEWNGKPEEECPDSHRYKACGNSFCVNCMRYIGMRIQMVENLIQNMEKENE
jgi:DNA (cytosine-5)-methyltransferase 1